MSGGPTVVKLPITPEMWTFTINRVMTRKNSFSSTGERSKELTAVNASWQKQRGYK
jgi:hypothetical protein